VITRHEEAVIATPGGMVSDAATYQLLLSECLTVWLQAQPTEHMQRVIQQGDLRPMAGNREAMDDLQRILHSRAPMYAKADLSVDTSGLSVDEALQNLLAVVRAST
jgi:XRE family aerobic/anaerobic benzoate catabolism transcriptional regulator